MIISNNLFHIIWEYKLCQLYCSNYMTHWTHLMSILISYEWNHMRVISKVSSQFFSSKGNAQAGWRRLKNFYLSEIAVVPKPHLLCSNVTTQILKSWMFHLPACPIVKCIVWFRFFAAKMWRKRLKFTVT